jgi:PilZ domain
MGATRAERRKTPRCPSSLPVVLEHSAGVLRDISLSGAFFWTRGTYGPEDPISFAIQLQTVGKPLLWKCEGNVVRTEQHGLDVGVGVRITRTAVEKSHPVPQ